MTPTTSSNSTETPTPGSSPVGDTEPMAIPPPPPRYAQIPDIPPFPIPGPPTSPGERYNKRRPPTPLDATHTKDYFKIFLKRDPVTQLEYSNFLKYDLTKYVYVHYPIRRVNLPGPAELLEIKEPVPASAFKRRKVVAEEALTLPGPRDLIAMKSPDPDSSERTDNPAKDVNVTLPGPGDLLALTAPVPPSELDAGDSDEIDKSVESEKSQGTDTNDRSESGDEVNQDEQTTTTETASEEMTD